jgi:hypothetical protein
MAIGLKQWLLKPGMIGGELIYELKIKASEVPEDELSAFKFVTATGEWLDVPDGTPNQIITHTGVRNFRLKPETKRDSYFSLPNAEEAPIEWTRGRHLAGGIEM